MTTVQAPSPFRQVLSGGLDAVVTTTTQGYYHPYGLRLATANTTVSRAEMIATNAGTFKKLRARLATGGAAGIGVGQTLVLAIYKNTVITALTVTMDGDDADGTEYTDLVNTFNVVAGDRIAVGSLNSLGGTQRIVWSFEFEST